jgi:hypothetical protein
LGVSRWPRRYMVERAGRKVRPRTKVLAVAIADVSAARTLTDSHVLLELIL